MNVISLGATFGALAWVFRDGHLASLLGFTAVGAIEAWVPVIVFVFAFGLSRGRRRSRMRAFRAALRTGGGG